MIDSQTIKAQQGKTRGYDAGKKVVGRKRHIAVDTDGRRDYEARIDVSQAMILVSLSGNLLRRTTHP